MYSGAPRHGGRDLTDVPAGSHTSRRPPDLCPTDGTLLRSRPLGRDDRRIHPSGPLHCHLLCVGVETVPRSSHDDRYTVYLVPGTGGSRRHSPLVPRLRPTRTPEISRSTGPIPKTLRRPRGQEGRTRDVS